MRALGIPGKGVWGALIGAFVLASGPPTARAGGGDETHAAPTRALPGLARVGVAMPHRPGVVASAATGYGYTEAVLDADDAHHRARGALALSYRPSSWFAIAAGFDARYDRHSGDGIDDSGYVGDPRMTARAVRLSPNALTLGAEATLWLPGEDAPSVVPGAATLEARALASYAPFAWGRHALHGNAGFRLDRSADAAPNADRLGRAQRVALGLSDSDAILLGVGWSAALAPATVFAEWTWDVHVGGDAPAPLRSPMRLGAGLHRSLGDRYQLFGLAEVSLSARPGVERTDPLVPVEPRASVLAGLSYRFGGGAGAPVAEPAGGLSGRVASAGGRGVAGASVRVGAGGQEVTVTTGADGSFEVDDIPAGRTGLAVEADGYLERTLAVQVEPRRMADVAITLERDLPDGQLKGQVLSFDGAPIAAEIRIRPGDLALSAGEDGTFEVDLAPGDYQVSIRAPGHRNQQRMVSVERRGVTVLNIDLRRER